MDATLIHFLHQHLSENAVSLILMGLAATSAVLPLLEKFADLTATDLDNRALKMARTFLSWIPRLRLGSKR